MSLKFWKKKPIDVEALVQHCSTTCLTLEKYHRYLVELGKIPNTGAGVPLNLAALITIATGISKKQAQQVSLEDAVRIHNAVTTRNDIEKMMKALVQDDEKKKTGTQDQTSQGQHLNGTSTPSL